MDYEFLGGNLALDFTNTLHSHGMSDPGEDLKTAADLAEWAAQAGLLRDAETHKLGRVHADQVRFRRALALRELLYEIFSRAARGREAPAAGTSEFSELLPECDPARRISPSGQSLPANVAGGDPSFGAHLARDRPFGRGPSDVRGGDNRAAWPGEKAP